MKCRLPPLSASIAIALLLAASPPAAAQEQTPSRSEQQVDILLNPSVAAIRPDLTELRALFSARKRQWDSGQAVRVFVLPDQHPLHKRFCRDILRVYPYVLRDTWDRMIFTGTGPTPVTVDSVAEMQKKVAETPGAIGYAPAAADAAGEPEPSVESGEEP